MTVDCRWIDKNLEAWFCDGLNEAESRLVHAHLENCPACRKEAQALYAIDPLIKNHFQRELQIARRPRVVHKGRWFGLAGAAAAGVAALVLLVKTPQPMPIAQPAAVPEKAAVITAGPTPAPIKNQDAEEVYRAKP